MPPQLIHQHQNVIKLVSIQGVGTGSGDRKPGEGGLIKSSCESNIHTGSFSDSIKIRQKYKDVADAAQAAFEGAEYAAVAARAAVELSRMDGRPSSSTALELKEESESQNKLSRTRSASSSSSSGEEEEEEENVEIPIPSTFQAGGLNLNNSPSSLRTRQVRGY